MTSRAIVQTAPRTLELRELPLPEIGPDDALLQVEACGICGSDYEQDEGALPAPVPKPAASAPPEPGAFSPRPGAGSPGPVEVPGPPGGDPSVTLGPGQRGLASVTAAREAGAGGIIVPGIAADDRKLELARG